MPRPSSSSENTTPAKPKARAPRKDSQGKTGNGATVGNAGGGSAAAGSGANGSAVGNAASAAAASEMPDSPSFDEIAEEAYQRYLRRGGQHGQDFDDWLEAERALKARRS